MQASSSQGRYQGYPYVNPHSYDVPTVDQATASRWTNLPRRQIHSVSREPCVVYVDIPDDGGQSSAEARGEPSFSTSRVPLRQEPDNPVVYIDLPESDGRDVTQNREERRERVHFSQRREEPSSSSSRPQLPFKAEPDENPVVYIDLPDEGGSDVSQNRDESVEVPQFVQETIFYDPFENRRIDVQKPAGTVRSNGSWNSESDLDSVPDTPPRRPPPRPARPKILDLSASSISGSLTPPISSISSSTSMGTLRGPSSLPDSYSRPLPESSLPSPLPITGFPEPPPAYTEFDIVTPTVVEQPRSAAPRTQVILPVNPNLDRKYLKCHHCGMHVHTLVIKEVGLVTHISALVSFMICMIPCVLMIYCMDCLKNKNHFCPNCNKIIGYELPLHRKNVVYVN